MVKFLWAKKQEDQGQFYWLPITIHLEDTRRVIAYLWEHWLSPGQKDLLMQSLATTDEEEAKQAAVFVAASHDLAKATPAFQTIKGYQHSEDLDERLLERLNRAGYGISTETFLTDGGKTPHALGGYLLLKNYGVGDDLASVVGAHHGSLNMGRDDHQQLSAYAANYYLATDSQAPVHQRWKEAQEYFFQWALDIAGYQDVSELPAISQPGQVILSGLLIMADWIASNENYFPLLSLEETEVDDLDQRAEIGWRRWFHNEPWEPEIGWGEALYGERFDFDQPREVQRVFAELLEDNEDPGLVILEAPMGLGKTEAALVGAEILAGKTGRSGIFFGLPTQATSNGIFPRVKNWLEHITERTGDTLSIRLQHGKSALNTDFTSLARHIAPDSATGSVTVNEWFAGRKTSALDDFVVGTVDHFLLTALKQKHLALRHLGFSKKVVILDEVHAYDSYMSQYLYRALHWMGAYNVPVIILSATLPAERREEMVIQYLRGKNLKKRQLDLPEEGLRTTTYPLVTATQGSQVRQTSDFTVETTHTVAIEHLADEDLLVTIQEAVAQEANVALIVNTVKRAQSFGEGFIQILGEDRVSILHSSFIATDRQRKEDKLLAMIGKGAKRPQGHLVIGTQVIEQSLDIDFDLMISDLAPMDLLIQRVGRLHRHEIAERPRAFQAPKLYLLGSQGVDDFEPGSQTVYGGYLLARTLYFLPESLRLPQDISPLVQAVYGDQPLELGEEDQALYRHMKKDHMDQRKRQEDRAGHFRLDRPSYPTRVRSGKSLVNWLEASLDHLSEERASAQVRDIEETLEVIALRKIGEGYGFFGHQEDISQGVDDPDIARRMAQQTLRLPIHYGLDALIEELEKYNLIHLKDWQGQAWLKGSLGIVFDTNHKFYLGSYVLTYDCEKGLTYERRS